MNFDEWLDEREELVGRKLLPPNHKEMLLLKLVRAQRQLLDAPYGAESTGLIKEIAKLEAALMGKD